MKNAVLAVPVAILLALGGGCRAGAGDRAPFLEAIEDAAVPLESEIDRSLVAITDDNPMIQWRDPGLKRELRVAMWMSDASYQKFYAGKTGGTTPGQKPVLWVTVAPQVKSFCLGLGLSGAELTDRLKEYLGLDPDRPYERFVELWVNRADLFRPCPDPQVDDSQCDLAMTGEPAVPRLNDYKTFFQGLYVGSYAANGAPWTRLGYTYDWNPESGETGASEFMLAPGSHYVIEGSFPTAEYCAG